MNSNYYTEYVTGPAGMTEIIRPRDIIDTFEDIFNISYLVCAVVANEEYIKFLNILRFNAGRGGRIKIVCWKFTYRNYYNDDYENIGYQKPIFRVLAFEKFSLKAK